MKLFTTFLVLLALFAEAKGNSVLTDNLTLLKSSNLDIDAVKSCFSKLMSDVGLEFSESADKDILNVMAQTYTDTRNNITLLLSQNSEAAQKKIDEVFDASFDVLIYTIFSIKGFENLRDSKNLSLFMSDSKNEEIISCGMEFLSLLTVMKDESAERDEYFNDPETQDKIWKMFALLGETSKRLQSEQNQKT